MNKHTKGPWFLDTCGDGSLLIQPREGFSICPVTPREGFEQDIPNFRLMAAAPELLAACKKSADFAQKIMNVLVGYQTDNFNSSVNSARGYAMSILDILWPAIAAAEGGVK